MAKINFGIKQETMEEAKGSAVAAQFELIPSGAYKGKIKGLYFYTNKFNVQTMKVIVSLDDFPDREVQFRQDIGATLKALDDGTTPDNVGYASRIKMIAHATGTNHEEWEGSDTPVKIKVFGQETDAVQVVGLANKTIVALVRVSENTNAPADYSYRMSNDVEGICAVDGTDASGESAAEVFTEKVAKNNGIFKYKGREIKDSGSSAPVAEVSEAQKKEMDSLI